MNMFEEVRSSLERELKKRQEKNPKYSLRAYANSLGISIARLSDVLNGRRKLSVTQIEKVNAALGGSLSFHLTNVSQYDNKGVFKDDEFELISKWIYLAVLSYLNSKRAEYSTASLAALFELSISEMTEILSRLERLQLVKKVSQPAGMGGAPSEAWVWVPGPEKTTDQTPSHAIKMFHKLVLADASTKLESVPVDQRDFSSSIVTIDPKKIPQAKDEIRKFRRKLATFLEEGQQSQVYSINIQFFPLSKADTQVAVK